MEGEGGESVRPLVSQPYSSGRHKLYYTWAAPFLKGWVGREGSGSGGTRGGGLI